MGEITDAEAEWAVVNRLAQLLADAAANKFNVTLGFACFTTILLWTKNRAWVGGDQADPSFVDEADIAASRVRKDLRAQDVTSEPWLVPLHAPASLSERPGEAINAAFAGMTAEAFVRWTRHAIAHGDGRNIKPVHRDDGRGGRWLAGFSITNGLQGVGPVTLHLFFDDLVRLGSLIAEGFCRRLSGGEHFRFEDAATRIQEGEGTDDQAGVAASGCAR